MEDQLKTCGVVNSIAESNGLSMHDALLDEY